MNLLFGKILSFVTILAARNVLTGIPASIGGLSRLIRLDLHQNSKLLNKKLMMLLLSLFLLVLEFGCLYLCRNLINPTINHGLSFTCRVLFGVSILIYADAELHIFKNITY